MVKRSLSFICLLAMLLMILLTSCQFGKNQHAQPVLYPCNKISSNDVQLLNGNAVIPNIFKKGTVVPTNSMVPTITSDSTILYREVNSYDDVCVGDIVAYQSCSNTSKYQSILHRIVAIGNDANGTFYTAKGDNNGAYLDSCKIRINNIKIVVVGIIY